jgi:hypothetical protein
MYEPLPDEFERNKLDDRFSQEALSPILTMLNGATISFYLVGEIASWYPDVPQRIVAAGHELGFHCHRHRTFRNVDDLRTDLVASAHWLQQYSVTGFRAPRVTIFDCFYPELEKVGMKYSSSVYATSGRLLRKGNIWEIPVSTRRFFGTQRGESPTPRSFSLQLLLDGELPLGSSFMSGIAGDAVLYLIEKELKEGLSPVIVLHSFELFCPRPWSTSIWRHLHRQPSMIPFVRNKASFLRKIVSSFPTSSMQSYLNELLVLRGEACV